MSNEERVNFELWHIPILVNNTPRPMGDDPQSVIERQRVQDTAENMLKAALQRKGRDKQATATTKRASLSLPSPS
jgi:hypothetical protein